MGRPPRSRSQSNRSRPGGGHDSRGKRPRPEGARSQEPREPKPKIEETEIRIVGGDFRGRKIRYSGDVRTRPMKNATREAMFNLVGGWIPQRLVIDLFAGTGAVGIEAISRGAECAHFIERHHPTARIIRDNLAALGVDGRAEVHSADALFWVRQFLKDPPTSPEWMVFVCPPYELFRSRGAEIKTALEQIMEHAPEGSVIVVEAPSTLDPHFFPDFDQWRFRLYEPAWLAVYRPGAEPFNWQEFVANADAAAEATMDGDAEDSEQDSDLES
ncbi:MAG: RsmD family RNA methyltransferase [Planctomycetales bacterium]|nr:RsmD family RNA methyltransferase [Planctomycetales bacterium]